MKLDTIEIITAVRLMEQLPEDFQYERFTVYASSKRKKEEIGYAMQVTCPPYGIIRTTGKSMLECALNLTEEFKLRKEKKDESK